MAKKTLATSFILFLLSSCISIKQRSDVPTPPQGFATVTLAPATTQWIPATPTVPPETVTPGPAMSASATCTNAAILLQDVTIPDYEQVNAGETFTKTWEFQNTGSCSWNNYTLRFTGGDEVNAPLSALMPAAAPNERVQVSMELTAPSADGSYSAHFELYDAAGNTIPIGAERTFWVKFRVGTYVAAPVSLGARPVPSGNCTYGPNANYVNEIISLINIVRANAGLQTLTVNTQMAAFAQSHSEDMAFNNFLSHDGSEASFGERMAGYSMTYSEQIGGEILAIGTPQNAMEQWSRDEHWDYVVRAHYTQIGVGYAYNSCSDYGGYFTVDLR